MPANDTKEIERMLEKLFVFDLEFKNHILNKAVNLNNEKFKELKKNLSEVIRWQEEILSEKIKKDPSFLEKIKEEKRKIDQEIIDLCKNKLAERDKKKMDIILEQIQAI